MPQKMLHTTKVLKSDSNVSKLLLFFRILDTLCMQSHINIGSDGTLARAPVWIGQRRGPLNVFLAWGPHFVLSYKMKYNLREKCLMTKKVTQNLINI